MDCAEVCKAYQLKKLKNCPFPTSSTEQFGVLRLIKGLKTLLILIPMGTFFLLGVATQDIPNGIAIKQIALEYNEKSDLIAQINGEMLMMREILCKESLLSSHIFEHLIAELTVLRLTIIGPQPPLVMRLFEGSGPIYRKSHTLSCRFTEETYHIPLFTYEQQRVIHVYSVLCSLSKGQRLSEDWKVLLALCNAQAITGTVKVREDQVIVEMCLVGVDVREDILVNTYCDYVSRLSHCFKGPICAFIDNMKAGNSPNPRRTLHEAIYNMNKFDRLTEIPKFEEISNLSLGAKVILTALLDKSQTDSAGIAMVIDAILHENSDLRGLAFALEVSSLLKTTEFSPQSLGFGPMHELDGIFPLQKYVE